MTVTELLRQRRAHREHEHTEHLDGALADTAAELRGRARPYLDAGRPDLALPYLDEATLFEAAMSGPRDL